MRKEYQIIIWWIVQCDVRLFENLVSQEMNLSRYFEYFRHNFLKDLSSYDSHDGHCERILRFLLFHGRMILGEVCKEYFSLLIFGCDNYVLRWKQENHKAITKIHHLVERKKMEMQRASTTTTITCKMQENHIMKVSLLQIKR